MLKLEFGKCCMECSDAYIGAVSRTMPVRSGRYIESTRRDVVVGCVHRKVCGRFLAEPLQALPAEVLFKD